MEPTQAEQDTIEFDFAPQPQVVQTAFSVGADFMPYHT